MRKLFDFIIAYKHWFLLFVLEAGALLFYFNDGLYRQGLRLYVEAQLGGRISEAMTEVHSYIGLRTENEALLSEKARLEHELAQLRRLIEDSRAERNSPVFSSDSLTQEAEYITARIVNRMSPLGETYYMINKGSSSGIQQDMGVMSRTGVVGTVMTVSENYSIVIPIINSKLRLSCIIQGKGYQGQLSSNGLGKPSALTGVSLQAKIVPGDTVVTSGFSYVFPEGLMVGTVREGKLTGVSDESTAFGSHLVSLSTDFDRLSYVYVLLTPPLREAQELELTLE